jgi:hypothetical protein
MPERFDSGHLKGAGKRLCEILEKRMILVFDVIERDSQRKRIKICLGDNDKKKSCSFIRADGNQSNVLLELANETVNCLGKQIPL